MHGPVGVGVVVVGSRGLGALRERRVGSRPGPFVIIIPRGGGRGCEGIMVILSDEFFGVVILISPPPPSTPAPHP